MFPYVYYVLLAQGRGYVHQGSNQQGSWQVILITPDNYMPASINSKHVITELLSRVHNLNFQHKTQICQNLMTLLTQLPYNTITSSL